MKKNTLSSLLKRIESNDTSVLTEIAPFIHENQSSVDPVFDALEQAADNGNAEFAEYLGYEYSFEYGAPRKGDAIKYLEMAADAHRSWAGYILAGIYQKKALWYLRQAAKDGSPSAAKEYLKGLADARPDAEAAFELATDIVRGLNQKASLESCLWYNLIAPSERNTEALEIIKEGRVMEEDSKKEAVKYARMAAEAGVPGADVLLASLS